jgi:hypothetical protein
MYKKVFLIIFFSFQFFFNIVADQVSTEYTKVEDFYNFKNSSDPHPDSMIRQNLAASLKQVVSRHIPDGKKKAESILAKDIVFDRIPNSNTIVTKFDEYVFEFRYGADPSKFHLTHTSHRFFKKDKNWQPQEKVSKTANDTKESSPSSK